MIKLKSSQFCIGVGRIKDKERLVLVSNCSSDSALFDFLIAKKQGKLCLLLQISLEIIVSLIVC